MTLEDAVQQVLATGKIDAKITCPFHVSRNYKGELGSEKTPSFGVNVEKQVFKCFGCPAKGSFVKLKSLLEGISYEQAKWDLYKGDVPEHLIKDFQQEETASPDDLVYPESRLACLVPAGEIPERDIDERETKYYGILQDQRSNLYIPLRDRNGSLRGCQLRYRGADEAEKGRYDQLLRFSGGSHIFGEHLLQVDGPEFRLIIVEGALDAVKLYGVLGIDAIALMSAHLTKKQKIKIARWPLKEVILWYDNDETGRSSARHNFRQLSTVVSSISGIKYNIEDDPKDACATAEERIKEQWTERVWFPSLGLGM